MIKLTNKAEFIDAAMDWLRENGFSEAEERAVEAETLWSRLVKRGLAKEKREPGWYWVKVARSEYDGWYAAEFDCDQWFLPEGCGEFPAIIGPRIDPPKD